MSAANASFNERGRRQRQGWPVAAGGDGVDDRQADPHRRVSDGESAETT
jgi:hypothetical protein